MPKTTPNFIKREESDNQAGVNALPFFHPRSMRLRGTIGCLCLAVLVFALQTNSSAEDTNNFQATSDLEKIDTSSPLHKVVELKDADYVASFLETEASENSSITGHSNLFLVDSVSSYMLSTTVIVTTTTTTIPTTTTTEEVTTTTEAPTTTRPPKTTTTTEPEPEPEPEPATTVNEPIVPAAPPRPIIHIAEQETTISLINQARAANGLKPLMASATLDAKAMAWAKQLASENALRHSSLAPGNDEDWLRLGENVGYGYSQQQIQDAYMESPGHRANILDPRFNYVGTGFAAGPNGRIFIVQEFMEK